MVRADVALGAARGQQARQGARRRRLPQPREEGRLAPAVLPVRLSSSSLSSPSFSLFFFECFLVEAGALTRPRRFIADFRNEFKKTWVEPAQRTRGNNMVTQAAKAAGVKWRAMSDAEKAVRRVSVSVSSPSLAPRSYLPSYPTVVRFSSCPDPAL